jgi:hypothetical protein
MSPPVYHISKGNLAVQDESLGDGVQAVEQVGEVLGVRPLLGLVRERHVLTAKAALRLGELDGEQADEQHRLLGEPGEQGAHEQAVLVTTLFAEIFGQKVTSVSQLLTDGLELHSANLLVNLYIFLFYMFILNIIYVEIFFLLQ